MHKMRRGRPRETMRWTWRNWFRCASAAASSSSRAKSTAGIGGFWDYGPLGVELKRNVKEAWWQDMVRNPPPGPDGQEIQMVGLDCSIIMNPKVWEASGHVGGFSDLMVDCRACKAHLRADQVTALMYTIRWDDDQGHHSVPVIFSGIGEAEEVKRANAKAVEKAKKANTAKGWPNSFDTAHLNDPTLLDEYYAKIPCPSCGQCGTLTRPRAFNLMFESHAGAIQSEDNKVYLRPETAQGIFVNFKNVLDSSRLKLPFGIAQVGKAFRNEINPRNYTFRSREFEQMEIEFFCRPDESMKWYQFWRDVRIKWYTQLGIRSDKLRPREQGKEELAHYSIGTTDIEYLFPFADEPQELEGVAHRGGLRPDAARQAQRQGPQLLRGGSLGQGRQVGVRGRQEAGAGGEGEVPLPAARHRAVGGGGSVHPGGAVRGVPRRRDRRRTRTVMHFHPRLAPIKAAVLPLVNKEAMPEMAMKLYRELKRDFNVFYDDGGAVGRRYRRQDEAGTPYCFTIDGQTLQDQTVTIRDRDTTQQRRIPLSAVAEELRNLLRA